MRRKWRGIRPAIHTILYSSTVRRLSLFCCACLLLTPSGARGMEPSRLENEIILEIPADRVVGLWQWLLRTFPPQCDVGERKLQCMRSVEHFLDVYFDTGNAELAEQRVGVRLRRRMFEDGQAKELLQVKMMGEHEGTIREENKFLVRGGRRVRMEDDHHPLLQYVRRADRDQLQDVLQQIDVEVRSLRPTLEIAQKRNRIYIGDPDPLLTLSLDTTSTGRLWVRETIEELDIEINEIRYTAADEQEQRRLMDMQRIILQRINDAFPGLPQDQTPKYTKMFERVFRRLPFGRTLLRWGLL